MRGLLIVNPSATTTTPRAREVLINSLAHQFQLETFETDHRGHGAELGALARQEGVDCVIVLGGDGTINEVVNGMLTEPADPAQLPALGVVPGGSANVFSRAIGFPTDPIEATGELISSLRQGRKRTISLGQANGRWFLCNAGLGLDAEIIASMEQQRAGGKSASPTRYLATTLRQYFMRTDRKKAALVVKQPGQPPVVGVFVAIIQNGSPWTYLGSIPVNPSPAASFDEGLDLWAIRSMSIPTSLAVARRMLTSSKTKSTDKVLTLHDVDEFTIACHRPAALQVDGESIGDVDEVRFTAHRNALQVLVPTETSDG